MEAFILICVLTMVLIAITVVLDRTDKLREKSNEHEPHESGYQDDTKDI